MPTTSSTPSYSERERLLRLVARSYAALYEGDWATKDKALIDCRQELDNAGLWVEHPPAFFRAEHSLSEREHLLRLLTRVYGALYEGDVLERASAMDACRSELSDVGYWDEHSPPFFRGV